MHIICSFKVRFLSIQAQDFIEELSVGVIRG